ncbi:MAG: GNAT family N-acetyltransferase [Lachnospiraceae bacterium]
MERIIFDDAEKKIFLTDDAALAKQLQSCGQAVIGICRQEDGQDWWSIPYLVEHESGADEDYCKEAYCRFHKIPIVVGRWEEFCLRELQESDASQIFALYDERAVQFLPNLSSIQEQKREIQSFVKSIYPLYGYGMWGLENQNTHELIGYVGFLPENWHQEEVPFLGYLIRSDYRQRGIAKKACQLGLDFLKHTLDIERVFCRISSENTESRKLAEKLGFIPLEKDIYIRYVNE